MGVALDTIAVHHGLGKHELYLSLQQVEQATKYDFLAIPWNLMSSAVAKSSVCFFLIHVNQYKKGAWFLQGASLLLILFAAASIVVLFTQCDPANALWVLRLQEQGKCIDPKINAAVGLAQASEYSVK